MAKKVARKRNVKGTRPAARQTNWLTVGGIIVIGAVVLFGLLYLALREPEPLQIAEYCVNNEDACFSLGDDNAPVTVVEVSDLGCPHCRDFHVETLDALISTFVTNGLVRWVALPYALSNTTLPATSASMCAGEQGAYYPFVDATFARFDGTNHLTRESMDSVAAQVGLDMDAFGECVDSNRYVRTIQANQNAARASGVTGTPSFFVNGRLVEGAVPLVTFQERIQAALEASGS